MPKQYQYLKDGVIHGPVTGKVIRELAAAGQIGPDDQIRYRAADGRWRWIRAGKVRDLVFAQPSPPEREASAVAPPAPAPPSPPTAVRDAVPIAAVSRNPEAVANQPSPIRHPPSESRSASAPGDSSGLPAHEYLLTVLWGWLALFWSFPIGFSLVMIPFFGTHKSEGLAIFSLVILVCVLVLCFIFRAIAIRSFSIRACLGLLFFLPTPLILLLLG